MKLLDDQLTEAESSSHYLTNEKANPSLIALGAAESNHIPHTFLPEGYYLSSDDQSDSGYFGSSLDGVDNTAKDNPDSD